MSFTRKHYEETARIVRYERGAVDARTYQGNHAPSAKSGARMTLDNLQSALARMFASDNPRFDAERFAKACEPGGGK